MRTVQAFLCLTLPLLSGCGNPTAPDVTGQWGGPEASMTLAPAGGTVAYACGDGTIDSGWVLTAGGRWSATGRHAPGGGPLPIGGRPTHPATYGGTVQGARLTFTVTLPDLGQVLGPFTVERGKSGPATECL